MKRIYIAPALEVDETLEEQPLAMSDVNSDNGIGYGGVDEDGLLDPAVREDISSDIW